MNRIIVTIVKLESMASQTGSATSISIIGSGGGRRRGRRGGKENQSTTCNGISNQSTKERKIDTWACNREQIIA